MEKQGVSVPVQQPAEALVLPTDGARVELADAVLEGVAAGVSDAIPVTFLRNAGGGEGEAPPVVSDLTKRLRDKAEFFGW